MSANTVISVKEIPILGEKKYENVSKATIIKWIEEMNQIRRAHPEIDTKLCILTQAVRPGVLKMMRLTLVKAGEEFVELKYPDNLPTTSTTAPAIAARQAFHDKWLDALRRLCSVEDQTAIIVKIQNVKLTPTSNGGRLTLDNVMQWATNLSKLFEDEAQAVKKVNSKEILGAVRRGMPIEMRQVVENSKPADPDHRDTWENLVERTSEIVRAYDALLPARRAIEGNNKSCLLYTSPSPRDATLSRMPSSA